MRKPRCAVNKGTHDFIRTGVVWGMIGCFVMATHATTNNLVHHWNFDEGQDWHDGAFATQSTNTLAWDFVGTAHAALTGMDATNWVSGRQFTALAFDGVNDYLAVTNNLALTLGGTASLSFWIKSTQAGTVSAGTSPGVAGVAGSGGAQWGWIDNVGRIGLAFDNTTVVQSTNSIADGNWHYVVLTRLSTGARTCNLYVDGVLHASAQGPSGAKSSAFYSLGRIENGGTPAYFAGRLDQIHVYNQVLALADIQSLQFNHGPKCWDITTEGVTNRTFTTESIYERTYDVERDTCAVTRWTQPARGTVSYNGDGSFNYTHTPGEAMGSDQFAVEVGDGRGGYHRANLRVATMAESSGGGMPITQYADFAPIQTNGVDVSFASWRIPRLMDWDQDGDLDLLVGVSGAIWRWTNTGTASSPAFTTRTQVQANGANITAGTGCIALMDMNGNGVKDLVAIDSSRRLILYVNTRAVNQSPIYSAGTYILHSSGSNFIVPESSFDLGDWNGDGLPDLATGTGSGTIRLYLNVGTAAAPRYNDTYTSLVSNSYNLYPRLFDLNGNGKTDFIHGINWGSITYYRDPFDRGLSGANFAITDSSGATLDMHSLLNGACVDFADLNNDGKLDIICGGNGGTDKIFVGYGVLRSVQESLTDIEAIYNVDTNNVGITLSANTNLLLNAVNTANWNLIARIQHGTLGAREELYSALTNHIAKYAFLKYQAHDVSKFHHVPSIVLMNWVMLTYAIPDTPTRRVEIANVMGLTNTMRTVYLEQGLAIGDAGTSYDATYRTVRDFMRRHPRELFPDCILTIDQLNGDGRGGFIWTPNSTKNTFGQWALGNANEWAGDLTTAIEKVLGAGKASGDYFTFVMGHEVTHSLDGYVNARANQDLRKRWGLTLCTAAGPDVIPGSNGWWDWTATKANFQAKGYWDGVEANWDAAWTAYWETGPGLLFKDLSFMRGNIEWFMGASQESLATQANHHWANGPGRLIGAVDRFRRGSTPGYAPMKANINEVATFIDYLSGGMNRVNLVETKNLGGTDEYVNWVDHYAELERNDKGYIQQIKVDGMTFRFATADNGVVTNVFTSLLSVNADDAWTFRNTPCVIEVLANDMNLEGGGVFQIQSVTQPANGTVVKNGDGTVTYTSAGSYTGFDTFSYTATTAEGGSATALVRVEVVNPATPSGSLLVEYWNGLSGSAVSALTGYANFPMSPSEKYYTNSVFELRKDFRENYGTRVRTLLVPNATGDYKFWIASDDNSELWLSTNHEPINKRRIAYVGDWTSSRQWTKYASQESVEIPLVAGRSYYIETLQKEGSGGDNLAVAWAGPDIYTSTNVIPSVNLRHPFSSYTEKKSVQWFKNGSGAWDTISSNWTANGSVATTFVEDDAVTLPDIGGLPSATLTLTGDYLLSALSMTAQATAYTIGGGFALQTPTFSKSGSGTFEIGGALTVTAEAVTNLSGTVTMGSLTTPGLALAESAQATFNALYTPSLSVAQQAQVTVTDPLSQLQGIMLNAGGLLTAPASAILSVPAGAGTLRLSSGTYRFGSSAFSAGNLDVTAGARGEVLYTATMPIASLSGAGTFAFVSSQSATVDPVPGNPVIAVPDFTGTLSLETLGAMRLNAFTAGNWKSWIESLPSMSTLAFGKGMQYFGPVCTLNSRLLFEDNAQVANTYQDSGGSFGQLRFGPGTALFNNTVNLGTNSHIRFGNHDTCTIFFQESIAGTNSLLEFGSGYPSLNSPLTIHLMAANTHALTQVRNSGGAGRVTLHLWHAEALGGGLRSVTSGSGGACAVNIGASTTAVDVVVASLEGTNSADTITIAHADSSLLLNNDVSSAFPGVLSGAGALLKSGGGSLTLAGNNTLGRYSFAGGTVFFNHANALGTNSQLTLGGTCLLDLTQPGTVVPAAPLALTLAETPSIKMAYNAATDMTINSVTGAGKLTLSVDVTGLAAFGDYRLLNAPGVLSSNAFELVTLQALPDNFKATLKFTGDGIYLRVTPVNVEVTLDAQGGSVSPSATNLLYDLTYGVLPTPIYTDFTFQGWWTEPNGLGTQVLESTIISNTAAHTLYALWRGAEPREGVISVNFGSDRASLESVITGVGLSSVPAKYWINVSEAGNTGGQPTSLVATNLQDGGGIEQVGSKLYACSSGGTWYAGNTTSQTERLLYGYLDDSNGSNPAGFKVTGIPYLKYRVYIYRSNDAGAGTTNRFGYHTVNGTAYSYINGVLTPGSTTNWGVTSYTSLALGENVMLVEDLSGDLTVLTASPGDGVRSCISAFQIESMMDAISVKVGAGGNFVVPVDNGTNYAGVAALGIKCSRWNNMTGNDETLSVVKSCARTNLGVTVAVDAAQAPWGPTVAHSSITNNHANTKLLGRYMDLSAGNQYTITVSNIPFARYSVYMIFSGDGGVYSPAIINGISYCGQYDTTISGTTTWGNRNATWSTLQSACGDSYLKEAYNYLKVTGLTGPALTLRNTISSSRGTLAGFQIVESAEVYMPGEMIWIGGAAGHWNTASNWSTGTVPSETDTVLFYTPAVVNLGGVGISEVQKIKIACNMLTLTNGTFTRVAELENAIGGLATFSTDSPLLFHTWPVGVYKAGTGTVTVNSIGYGAADLLRISGMGGLTVTNGGTIGTLRMESENSTFEVTGGTLAITTALQPQWRSNLKITGSAVVTIAGVTTVADVHYEFSGTSQTTVTGTWHYNSWSDVLFKDSAKVITTAGMQYGDNDWVRVMDNADLTCTQLRFNETTGANTTFTMTGGKVTATATGTSKSAAFHLAHWNNGNPRFYLNGGEMIATNGTMALGVDGTCTVYLGGSQIKVKRFEPATNSEFYMTNGVLNVGVDGIVNAGTKPLYLAGGTITAWGNWSSAKAMTLTNTVAGLAVPGDVTFDTAGYTLSLTGAIDGEGGLSKSGAGTLSLAGANAYSGLTTIQSGTVIPKHATALGSAQIALAGGTLDVRASGAVVPLKTLNVLAPSTLRTTCALPANLTVGVMDAVLTLNVDITGAPIPGEYKLLKASSTPEPNDFTLEIAGSVNCVKKLVFKEDGVYLRLVRWGTLYNFQ